MFIKCSIGEHKKFLSKITTMNLTDPKPLIGCVYVPLHNSQCTTAVTYLKICFEDMLCTSGDQFTDSYSLHVQTKQIKCIVFITVFVKLEINSIFNI